jgi:hypothetical protein
MYRSRLLPIANGGSIDGKSSNGRDQFRQGRRAQASRERLRLSALCLTFPSLENVSLRFELSVRRFIALFVLEFRSALHAQFDAHDRQCRNY